MKTLLVPTDFDLVSLKVIPHLLAKYRNDKISIIFVHLMSITDCERELMMLSRRSAEYRHIPDTFYHTCSVLRNNDEQIIDIRIEFFYGNTVSAFKNFLEANGINQVIMLSRYDYDMLESHSIQPGQLLKQSAISPMWIDLEDELMPQTYEPEIVYN